MNSKNKTRFILIIVLFLVIVIYLDFATDINKKDYELAKAGSMNISEEDLQTKLITLDGNWEFYPGKFVLTESEDKEYMSVPSRWNNSVFNGKKLTAYAYGTYHLKLKLPSKGVYCFNFRYISSAYTLYIDGKKFIENGRIATSYQDEVATWRPRILPFYAESDTIDIILQVSNFHHNKGGIINSILFGSCDTIYDNNILNIIKSAIMLGSFTGIGIYLTFIYQSRSKKCTYLYLGLFCFSSLVLETIINDSLIYYIFPDLSFFIITKIEYLSCIGIGISLLLFFQSVYPQEAGKYRFIVMHAINIAYFMLVIFTDIRIYGFTEIIYLTFMIINSINFIITLIKAVLYKRRNAKVLLFGCFTMVLILGLDILANFSYKHTYSTSYNYSMGLLFFLICQLYVLSIETLEAFKSSQKTKDMEIAFLQAQIAPHFIFNTLNNIYCLMESSVPKARGLILDFCNFLRVKYKFDYRSNVFCTLNEEIELIKSFIKIENTRFQDAIHFEISVPEEYMQVSIPQLLIQPMVENSIKHGFCSNSILITISAEKIKDSLKITVSDNGKGMSADNIARILNKENIVSGVGLKNVNYRLNKCYNTSMMIKSEITKGTHISFQIPLEVQDEGCGS